MTGAPQRSRFGPIVVDASVSAAIALPDERYEHARPLLADITEHGAIVPSLFWYEIRSLLLNAERRGRITAQGVAASLLDLRALGFSVAPENGDDALLDIARACELTAYDAAYALLAVRMDGRLATLDKALVQAADTGAFALWSPTSAPQI